MDSFSGKILKDESLTFAEKILSIKSSPIDGPLDSGGPKRSRQAARAGDVSVVSVDMTLAQDSTGPLAIKSFHEMGLKKVFDPSKIFIFLDHTYPASDEKVANMHQMVREFCKAQGCTVVEGSISHQHMLEQVVVPGMLLLGADSHTTQAGALAAFSTGIGSTEMAAIWASGRIWLKVPESIKIRLEGQLKKGVFARDIVMSLIGQLGEDGANYKSLEWNGSLTIDSRACISNNSVECGAKNSFFQSDSRTRSFLEKAGRKPMLEIFPGKKASYSDEIEINLSSLEPQITFPEHVDRVKPLSEAIGQEIDQAFLGSTTNCRLEDLEVAGRILKGRKVRQGTRLVITPASKKVWLDAVRTGLVNIFVQAGAVFTNSTCGACVGTHMGVLGEKEICVSSSPRNYSGRMGSFSSRVFLASPAIVAASAIEGRIADPRKYL